jgi:hypothetical protein
MIEGPAGLDGVPRDLPLRHAAAFHRAGHDQALALLDSEAQRRLAALRVAGGLAEVRSRYGRRARRRWARWSNAPCSPGSKHGSTRSSLATLRACQATWPYGLVPVALLLVTVYIAIYGLAVMRGEATEPVGTFRLEDGQGWCHPVVCICQACTTAAMLCRCSYWPAGRLGTLFVAPRAVAAATAFGALDLANTAANEQLALLWKDAGMFRLDLVLASLLFSLGTTIFLVLGAFVALLGKLILTFALAIGPMAILCLLFKPTARFFDSWLSFVLSAVVLSWFVFFALGHVFVRLGPGCFCHR